MGIKLNAGEKGFTQEVIKAARLAGWRVAHFRTARTIHGWRTPVSGDGKGFPDLVLVRAKKIIFAELKVGNNQLTNEQSQWASVLIIAGVPCYVWRPEMWTLILETLR